MPRNLLVQCRVRAVQFLHHLVLRVRSPANQFLRHLVAPVAHGPPQQVHLAATEAVGTAADLLAVVAQHVLAEDHVQFLAPEPLQQVAVAVVLVAVVPVALQVVAHQSGRDVVVATAKSCSR